MKKRGQVTIFVILGIFIVVTGILVFSLIGGPQAKSTKPDENPQAYMQKCLQSDFWTLIDNLSMNGGSINPEYYHQFYGHNVAFLCSSATYYELCSINQPFLLQHVQSQLNQGIKPKVDECFSELVTALQKKNYNVTLENGTQSVDIVPNNIILKLNRTLTMTKSGTKVFNNFNMQFPDSMYQLVGIATGIVQWESLVGDANVDQFMSVYQNFLINKTRGADSVKIYNIIDQRNGDNFQFASRSMVFPPGLIPPGTNMTTQ